MMTAGKCLRQLSPNIRYSDYIYEVRNIIFDLGGNYAINEWILELNVQISLSSGLIKRAIRER